MAREGRERNQFGDVHYERCNGLSCPCYNDGLNTAHRNIKARDPLSTVIPETVDVPLPRDED